jgi:hypothetical protein
MDFSNVPGQMISGIGDDVLKWIEDNSSERYLSELGTIFEERLNDIEITELDEQTVEDSGISTQVEQMLDQIEINSIPESTKKQMHYNTKKFRKFLIEKKLDAKFEKLPYFILNKYLRYFYSELTKEDGSPYAPPSLICIRAALQRFLSLPEHGRQDINIISGNDFASSNRIC